MKGITNKALLLALISMPVVAMDIMDTHEMIQESTIQESTPVVESTEAPVLSYKDRAFGYAGQAKDAVVNGSKRAYNVSKDAVINAPSRAKNAAIASKEAVVNGSKRAYSASKEYAGKAKETVVNNPKTSAAVAVGTVAVAGLVYKYRQTLKDAASVAVSTVNDYVVKPVANVTDLGMSFVPGYARTKGYFTGENAKNDFMFVVFNTIESLKKDEAVEQINIDEDVLAGLCFDATEEVVETTKSAIRSINKYAMALDKNGALTQKAKSNLDELYAWVYSAIYDGQ